MQPFVNLHTNTEYSIFESSLRIQKLVEWAVNNNVKTLAVTDHNVMYGVPEFLALTKKHNIKPVIGVDLDVEDYRLILLAQNHKGYQELMRLSTMRATGQEITLAHLNTTNLFVVDHPRLGYFVKHRKPLKIPNYFVGLSKGEHPKGVRVFEVRSLHNGFNPTLTLLRCIKNNTLLQNETKVYTTGMKVSVAGPKLMVDQATLIAARCKVVFPKKTTKTLPLLPGVSQRSLPTFFAETLHKKLAVFLAQHPEANKQTYKTRLNHEVQTVLKLGFANYFLVIADVVNWARNQKITVGPGRGSAAGSLVAFLLGITSIDPVHHGLIFERFLNSARRKMPDIDVDFQDDRRSEVLRYLVGKYGTEHVAQIITFARFGAKLAIRDVGRITGANRALVDSMCKHFLPVATANTPLVNAFKTIPGFAALVRSNLTCKRIFKSALLIEGLPRQTGIHAAGVVLCKHNLETVVPLAASADHIHQTQYSMEHLENHGLLKIDILGLRNLTTIQKIQTQIRTNHFRTVNLKKINFADPATNRLLSAGDTLGVFQLESWGMRRTLNTVGVKNLADVAVIIALYRPGPMDSIGVFAKNKKFSVANLPDVSLRKILEPTRGVLVYQEQIMKVIQVFANIPLAEADRFIGFVSKKNVAQVALFKKVFVNASIKNKRDPAKTQVVWDLITKFGRYGFNKAHAVAYATLAYQMAFLKSRFPVEFYTAVLEANAGDSATTNRYLQELKQKRISFVAPEVNSAKTTYYNRQKAVYLPLTLVRGVGTMLATKVVKERDNNGPYVSFLNFVTRSKLNSVPTAVITDLIKAQVLRKFGNVATLLASLPSALRYATIATVQKNGRLKIDENIVSQPLLVVEPREIKQEIAYEKELFGFSLNTFRTDKYQSANTLSDLPQKKVVRVVVLVTRVKTIRVHNQRENKAKDIAFITVSDHTNQADVFVNENLLHSEPVITRGKIYKMVITASFYRNQNRYRLSAVSEVKEN